MSRPGLLPRRDAAGATTGPDGIHAADVVVRRGGRTVLHGVDLTARPGRTVGIIGPNGAGKSTLLKTLNRELACHRGTVVVGGDDVTGLGRRDLARRVAVVAQDQEASLPLSVRDVVMLGRLPHLTLVAYGDADDRALVDEALDRVRMREAAGRSFDELSGGERQRVLIARAIVQQASHLLLDEPTNHLDLHHQFVLLDLVRDLRATTVLVLHDLNLAARSCDELVLLDHGRIVASGPADEVLDPALVSDVYHVRATAIEHAERRHLIFDGEGSTPAGNPCNQGENR